MTDVLSSYGVLDKLRDLARSGGNINASVITTYSWNALFYEEVVLRSLQRAGSQLNIVFADSAQLARSLPDPLGRPKRAGDDYILVPVSISGAFHPKLLMLLSNKRPLLAVGSNNLTDCGFTRNEEMTVCWGERERGVPTEVLTDALDFVIGWLRASSLAADLVEKTETRLAQLALETPKVPSSDATFLGWNLGGPSLIDQIAGKVTGNVRKAWVIAPYFDSDLRFLREIATRWSPEEIFVGIQPDTALLLRPELAPRNVKFVDISKMKLPHAEQIKAPFLHAKLFALESENSFYMNIGSANASGTAWMQEQSGNAEAIILLEGNLARKGFKDLGLEHLGKAPRIDASVLKAIGERSKQVRASEKEADQRSVQTIAAAKTEKGWFLPGLNAATCKRAFALDEQEQLISCSFETKDGGTELSLAATPLSAGFIRVDDDMGPIAFAVLNNPQRCHAMLKPRDARRLLDALGSLERLDGFDELFDVFDRHVLGTNPPEASSHSMRTKIGGRPPPNTNPELPFGPRGISLPSVETTAARTRLFAEDYITDFINALINQLHSPALNVADGDDDRDDEEGGGASLSASTTPPVLDGAKWDQMVTACRKRVGTLLGRLERRLGEKIDSPDKAAWMAGRILAVIFLMQKLRLTTPPAGAAPTKSGRMESLVGTDQLRRLFKASMRALYGDRALARYLETSELYRASGDRRLLDELLLWMAREIGIDFDRETPFNEERGATAARLRDRIDGLVVAMSASAHSREPTPIMAPDIRPWADAPKPGSTWLERHLSLGDSFQRNLSGSGLPTLKRPAKTQDIVVWKQEPNFPRIAIDVDPKRASLIDPGDAESGKLRKVQPGFLVPIDVSAMRCQ